MFLFGLEFEYQQSFSRIANSALKTKLSSQSTASDLIWYTVKSNKTQSNSNFASFRPSFFSRIMELYSVFRMSEFGHNGEILQQCGMIVASSALSEVNSLQTGVSVLQEFIVWSLCVLACVSGPLAWGPFQNGSTYSEPNLELWVHLSRPHWSYTSFSGLTGLPF